MAFRDGELLKIFQMALETLDRVRTIEAAQRHTLLEEVPSGRMNLGGSPVFSELKNRYCVYHI